MNLSYLPASDPSRYLLPKTLKLLWVAWLPVTSRGDNKIVAMSESEQLQPFADTFTSRENDKAIASTIIPIA